MQATTPKAIRDDFKTQILAISPSHEEYRNAPWRYVASQRDVPGPELRTFTIDNGTPEPDFDTLASPEAGAFQYEMRVWTSYGALGPEDDDSIIHTDGAQLWSALANRYTSLTGFVSAMYQGFEKEEEEDGRIWGAHVFEVKYVQALSVTIS